MNRIVVAIACALTSGAGGLALAQTPPPDQQPPPATAPPGGEQQSPTAPADSGSTTTSADQREQIRECVAKQQRSNSGMSNRDATTYCINQVKNAPPPR